MLGNLVTKVTEYLKSHILRHYSKSPGLSFEFNGFKAVTHIDTKLKDSNRIHNRVLMKNILWLHFRVIMWKKDNIRTFS
jgi:hypothetical protein